MADPLLSAVSVTNGSAIGSVTSSMTSVLTSSGNIKAVTVTLTVVAASKVKVNGADVPVTSTTASFIHDFSNSKPVTIVVTDSAGENPETYTLLVVDELQDMTMTTITKVGWFSAREFKGDLDAYTAGGVPITTGSFKPKHIVSIQITGGFWGEFDFENSKLKVYKAVGTEATKADLAAARFQMILME